MLNLGIRLISSYVVSNLVKTECKNAMLVGDMNISRLMTHAQQVEGYKIKEHGKENNKSKTGNYDYSQQKSGGGNQSQSPKKFLATTPSSASVPSSKTGMAIRVEHHTLILREVFQALRLTPLSLSVVRTIRVSVSQEKKDALGEVSLVIG